MLHQNCYWWPHTLDCLHQKLSRNQTPRLTSSLQNSFTANCFDLYVKIATISSTRYHSYFFFFLLLIFVRLLFENDISFRASDCAATIWEWRLFKIIHVIPTEDPLLILCECWEWEGEKIESGALGPKLSALTTWTQVTLLHFNLQSTQWVIDIKGYFVHRCHYVCVSVAF